MPSLIRMPSMPGGQPLFLILKRQMSPSGLQGLRVQEDVKNHFPGDLSPSESIAFGIDSRQAQGEEFYKDSRNIGLWAKKASEGNGGYLGPKFDEIAESARPERSGKYDL